MPAGLGQGGGGAELRGAEGQGCGLPPGMGDVAPHLWMPVALRLLEVLGDLREGCCGGLNEHAYGAWELYPWAVRSVLCEAQPPPQARGLCQLADLDELVREVAAGAEQDDGLRRLLRASLRMCGQGAQSRLCLPGFALEAVRGAVRGAVARRPGGRPDEVDAASQLLRRAVCQGDVAGCCLTPGIYCSTMIHEPLLRLLGEDASAPNIGLPEAGPGLCDLCREPWRGIGAARACARVRRSTELRGAELRLEAAPAPGCRAEIGAGGRAEAGDGDDQAGGAGG